ncbi:hypothetical protein [Cysteiniphilum sp. 6C5]|uniref:hypothetical protein n=1 Tax=unclassified Cysteiniphilum TaxID=2610889 RepID=UPI003F842879
MKKKIILLISATLTLSAVSYAANPTSDCNDSSGFVTFCHGGGVVHSWDPCDIHGDGTGDAWNDRVPIICRTDMTDWYCEHKAGTWVKQATNNLKCSYPEYKFDIHNQTAYALDQYKFTGYYLGIGMPDVSDNEPVPSGESITTKPIDADIDYAMLVTPTEPYNGNQAGEFDLYGGVDHKLVSASDVMIESQDKDAHLYDRVSLRNQSSSGDNDVLACIIPVQGDGQWSLPVSYDSTTNGVLYLYPNILEAKVNLCVNLPTPATSDIAYQFKLDDFSNLEQDDITLYPAIGTQTTITQHIGPDSDLGVINFTAGESGTHCVAKAFYFKTKQKVDCENLINNRNETGINGANISISMSDPKGQIHRMTLKPSSNISQTKDRVDALYKLKLISQEDAFEITPGDGGDKNTSLCPEGVCSDETITFNPS